MITCDIEPHISETNATGHIDNATVPVWLERARSPIYRVFNPDLSPTDWNMIIRRIEIDFIHEIQYQDIVTINSYVQEIRNSSFSVVQELFQNQKLTAKGTVVLVYYDYSRHQKMEITGEERERLQGLAK
jgi:acyl-CoA thioester hydrolase